MIAYIAVSFALRKQLEPAVQTIKTVLSQNQITPLVFVDKYNFSVNEEKLMMQTAMHEINNCSFLIAETTDKGIGIGIEAGFAKAKNKPVIYLRNAAAAHSTTLAGLSNFQVIYTDTVDLAKQLTMVLSRMNAVVY